MPQIEIILHTRIGAPIERCFDLARSIDFPVQSATQTQEKAVFGVTHGLIGPHQKVEWRARHLGLCFNMRVSIIVFDPPTRFQDSILDGPFRSFIHDHDFAEHDSSTMTDRLSFSSHLPHSVDKFFLSRYLRAFIHNRNLQLKAALESDLWRPYLRPQL